MMRTAEAFAVAVRRPTGEVVVRRRRLPPRAERPWVGQLPLLRGLVAFFDGVFLGYLALCFSLVQASGEGSLATADVGADAVARRAKRTGATATFVTLLAFSLFAPVALVLGPACLDALCAPGWLRLAGAGWPKLATAGAQLAKATAQLAFLPAYVALVAQLPPLHRLCGYHGAEHKVRAAYAAGVRLTLLNVRRQPARVADCRLHFCLSFAAVVTVLFFALAAVLPAVPPPVDVGAGGELLLMPAGFWLHMVALVPAVGLAHELRRWQAGRLAKDPVAHWHHPAPTVREPDAAMLEVALAALQAVLDSEMAEDKLRSPAAALAWRRLDGAMPLGALPNRARKAPGYTERAQDQAHNQAEAACCTS